MTRATTPADGVEKERAKLLASLHAVYAAMENAGIRSRAMNASGLRQLRTTLRLIVGMLKHSGTGNYNLCVPSATAARSRRKKTSAKAPAKTGGRLISDAVCAVCGCRRACCVHGPRTCRLHWPVRTAAPRNRKAML